MAWMGSCENDAALDCTERRSAEKMAARQMQSGVAKSAYFDRHPALPAHAPAALRTMRSAAARAPAQSCGPTCATRASSIRASTASFAGPHPRAGASLEGVTVGGDRSRF